jgi:hypothetical protein
MALLVVSPKGVDIRKTTLNLEIPEVVKLTLKQSLRPYLGSIMVDGYADKKKRKVFILGNTGNYQT